MKNEFLTGERIYLRPVTIDDAPLWYRWFNDPEVIQYMEKGYFPNTEEKQVEYITAVNAGSDVQLAITDKKNDELIGGVGLHGINLFNRNADISIILGNKKYWKKGIGKEVLLLMVDYAFNRLNLHKVTGGMSSCNSGSFNLFKSCGFKEEGRLKEQVFLNGKYYDIIKMGLLYADYVDIVKNTGAE